MSLGIEEYGASPLVFLFDASGYLMGGMPIAFAQYHSNPSNTIWHTMAYIHVSHLMARTVLLREPGGHTWCGTLYLKLLLIYVQS